MIIDLSVLDLAGKKSANVSQFQLWTDKVINQKINYINNNPVAAGLVTDPIHYKYSSARNYQDDNTMIEIDDLGFMG